MGSRRAKLALRGRGGLSAGTATSVHAALPPTPDPSPPRARARGWRGAQKRCSLVRDDGNIFPIQISCVDGPCGSGAVHPIKQRICVRILAAQFCPSFALSLERRGAGNAGCRLHPRSRVQSRAKENAHEHTGSAEALRHSLRNGLTAYFELSPENRALLSPSPANSWRIRARSGRLAFRRLDANH